MVSPAGLLGSEQAITSGTQGALNLLGAGVDLARSDIMAGGQGLENQAALAGLRGNEAQAAAFQNFQASPGQQFLQQEAERALTRNAARTGGLGGGNVLRDLQQQAIGLAQQDFANQFQRGQQVLGSQQQQASNLANIAAQGGLQGANVFQGGANLIGGQRFQAGQQLAQQAQQQANLQAQLQQQLGTGLAGVTGQTGTNLANLVSGTGTGSAQLQQQLATLLANIGTGAGSNIANLQSLAGQFDAAGIAGQGASVQNALQQLALLNAIG